MHSAPEGPKVLAGAGGTASGIVTGKPEILTPMGHPGSATAQRGQDHLVKRAVAVDLDQGHHWRIDRSILQVPVVRGTV